MKNFNHFGFQSKHPKELNTIEISGIFDLKYEQFSSVQNSLFVTIYVPNLFRYNIPKMSHWKNYKEITL